MKNKTFNIIFLLVVVLGSFYYKTTLENIWKQSYQRYFPCRQPITYSIGQFDTKFGISKEDFIKSLATAEAIWEDPISKNLFEYRVDGDLKINLVYDIRQEATTKLQDMGLEVDNSKATYDVLNAKYKSLISLHSQNVVDFETRVKNFEARKKSYESEVSLANKRGGANKETVNALNNERDYLNSEVSNLRELQNSINNEVSNINALAVTLNQIAQNLNINVKNYNTIGELLPSEFNEGMYRSDSTGQEIDIYQFDNNTKLVRVLAHELGHALGLDHVDDPKAIMYRLNNGINEKIMPSDLVELKGRCGVK